jgi:hypothetical protein
MAHYISGFIAKFLGPVSLSRPSTGSILCPLAQGFFLIPIADETGAPDEAASSLPNFSRLSQSIEDWARAESVHFPICWIETEYFGGLGTQAAVVWANGNIALGPLPTRSSSTDDQCTTSNNAINCALRMLGVVRSGSSDEFDTLGLGQHRSNESWLASVSP